MDAPVLLLTEEVRVLRKGVFVSVFKYEPAVRMKDSRRKDFVRNSLQVVQSIWGIRKDNVELLRT